MYKLFLLIFSATTLLSCEKQFDGLTSFNISYTEETVIQSSTGVNLPFNISTPPVATNSETKFKNENTRKDLIKEIFLESLSATIKSPNSADFSFLEEISIYINADGLAEKKIAWKTPVTNGTSNKIHLNVSSDDLQEYIKKNTFTLRVNAVTDEVLTQDHTLEIKSTFDISAKLIN